MNEELESTSLVERIVLCCLVDLAGEGETPVNTAELREIITERLEGVGSHHVGRVAEADVMRALNGLSEQPMVSEERPDDRSPVGKGRPVYDLTVDPAPLREALADDDRLRPILEYES